MSSDANFRWWTVGGGIEYAVLPSTSIGVEYDYINLSGNSDTVPITYSGGKVGPYAVHNADFTTQTVMARVTFHLLRDEPVAPLK